MLQESRFSVSRGVSVEANDRNWRKQKRVGYLVFGAVIQNDGSHRRKERLSRFENELLKNLITHSKAREGSRNGNEGASSD